MQTAFHASTEEVLIQLFLQISAILLAARVVGCLFKRLGQSEAIGEIFAGVLLGPSFFGWVFPQGFHWLFPSEGPQVLPFFSHMGLVLALFLIGMEFDYGDIPRHARQVVGIALATLVIPMMAGIGLAFGLWQWVPGGNTFPAYALFVGLSMAITAIPIMGRILMELGLTKTHVGTLGITAGAVKDLCMWFVLAAVIGVARPPLDGWKVGRMVLLTLALAAFVLTAGRWLLERVERAYPVKRKKVNPYFLSGLLIVLLLLSAATSRIGIFAIFGAFLSGVAISHRRELSEAVSDRLHDLTILFFLPIFFTYTGLRADLTQLGGGLWLWFVMVTVAGTLANGLPTYLLSRRAGMDRNEGISMAALINTPGLMVMILLNIGLDLQVISQALFSILMASALVRDLITTPVLRRWAVPEAGRKKTLPAEDQEAGTLPPVPAAARPSTLAPTFFSPDAPKS